MSGTASNGLTHCGAGRRPRSHQPRMAGSGSESGRAMASNYRKSLSVSFQAHPLQPGLLRRLNFTGPVARSRITPDRAPFLFGYSDLRNGTTQALKETALTWSKTAIGRASSPATPSKQFSILHSTHCVDVCLHAVFASVAGVGLPFLRDRRDTPGTTLNRSPVGRSFPRESYGRGPGAGSRG